MAYRTRLSVNVDHVATLRQARGVGYPDPRQAAALAEEAGAAGITIHLRQDRRHIQDRDLVDIRAAVKGKLNLEISTRDEMIAAARSARPHQVTLVPERPDEVTTEGGLDLRGQISHVRSAAEALVEEGISVSLFVDPDPELCPIIADLGEIVAGFEINTDAYSRARADDPHELEQVVATAERGEELGLEVYAGHGLTVENVTAISEIAPIRELNIGHSVVSRAVLVGFPEATRELLAAMGSLE